MMILNFFICLAVLGLGMMFTYGKSFTEATICLGIGIYIFLKFQKEGSC